MRWYDPLPPVDPLPPAPISGWLLLRVCLGIDALLLIVLALRTAGWSALPAGERVPIPRAGDPGGRVASWLWIITVLGLVLRIISLDSDLWLDEVAPLLLYGQATVWQTVTSYISANNHLLNTVLVNGVVAVAGEAEWSVRLPALVFGVATIPLLYRVARLTCSRAASLAASLLLAVSYHHIFFSQNARGYTAFVFFALAASGLLVEALVHDRRRDWAAYVACVVLGMTSLLVFGFVLAGHALVGVAAVLVVRRHGATGRPLARRVAAALAAAAWLAVHVYVVVLPDIYVYVRAIYVDPAVGFAPLSSELARELLRALSTGLGRAAMVAVVPAAIVGAIGVRLLYIRNPLLLAALAAPLVIQFACVVAAGLLVLPRTFLHALPLVLLILVAAMDGTATWLGGAAHRRGWRLPLPQLVVVAAAILALVSAAALPAYYRTPKQPYRAALAHVDALTRPEGIVIVAHYARGGAMYYSRRMGLAPGRIRYAHTDAEAAQVLADAGTRPVAMLTTFPRALRLDQPDLDARLERDWRLERRFRASVSDGDLLVWVPAR